jgi:hypothetical protein
MTRNGRPAGAASGDTGGEVPQIADRIKGPLHQRLTRTVGESEIVDTFFAYMTGAEETDAFQWVSDSLADGTPHEIPGQTVVVATPTATSTMITVTYSSALSASIVKVGCFANGVFFYGNVEIGSIYGGDYP